MVGNHWFRIGLWSLLSDNVSLKVRFKVYLRNREFSFFIDFVRGDDNCVLHVNRKRKIIRPSQDKKQEPTPKSGFHPQ